MPMENFKKFFKDVSGKLLEIHRNERCEAVSSREWERVGADTRNEREPNRRLLHLTVECN